MPRYANRLRPLLIVLATLSLAGCERFCGGGSQPDQKIPTVKGPDGREYVLLARGAYKPFFDAKGQLERVEYDRNGDGKPDQWARHNGQRIPQLVENDDDFDGTPDKWIYYDAAGVLQKVGTSRKGNTKPDFWVLVGPDSKPSRNEYDDDGDGKIDRAEVLKDGRVDVVEVDGDRNGKMDRWQHWQQGKLLYEDLDTDGDGKPDRRLRYSPKGEVIALEPIGK